VRGTSEGVGSRRDFTHLPATFWRDARIRLDREEKEKHKRSGRKVVYKYGRKYGTAESLLWGGRLSKSRALAWPARSGATQHRQGLPLQIFDNITSLHIVLRATAAPPKSCQRNPSRIELPTSHAALAFFKVDFCSSQTFPSSSVYDLVDSVKGVSEIFVARRAVVYIVRLHRRTVFRIRRQSAGPSLQLPEMTG
jgi:hypothetical protein